MAALQPVILIQQQGLPQVYVTNYVGIHWFPTVNELNECKAWMSAYGYDVTIHQVTEASSFGPIFGSSPF